LEDIIEEIIGDEIVDETDAFVDGSHSVKVNRLENFDWGRLRLLDSKIVDQRLSHDEVRAITAHLRTNYTDSFSLLTDHQLQRLVAETSVEDLPCCALEVGQQVPDDVLYERGVVTDTCTLILSGKVTVLAGEDKFRSDVSSWSLLGAGAFKQALYVPDFTAFVISGPCRCIRINKDRFNEAADASAVERTAHVLPAVTVVPAADDPFVIPTMMQDTLGTQVRHPVKAQKSRRSKIIAALQRIEHTDVVAEDVEKEDHHDGNETSHVRRGVGYASDGALNSVLTDGGTYQHKKVGLASTPSLASSEKSPDNNIEFLGPNE
jgi:ribosomal protein L14E/L6E/L27E